MVEDGGLFAFAENLREELAIEATADGAEALIPEVLTRRGIEILMELGELEEASDCYLRMRGIEVSGVGIEDDDTLNIVSTIHRGDLPPSRVTKSEIGLALKRAEAFWTACRTKPIHSDLEESSDAWSMT